MKTKIMHAILFSLATYLLAWAVVFTTLWSSVTFEIVKVALVSAIILLPAGFTYYYRGLV